MKRFALVLAAVAVASLGASCDPTLGPAPGAPQYQELVRLPVFGGVVNVAGGNLMLRGVDLSIDTRLGTYELGRSYNSSNNTWRFSFEMAYDGTWFTDDTGAEHYVAALANGAAIPGTHWVKMNSSTIKTKGGWMYSFASGRLFRMQRVDVVFPLINFVGAAVAGQTRTVEIEQCEAANDCTTFFDLNHDSLGRVNSVTDRAGRTAIYTYDAVTGFLRTARSGLDTARNYPGTRYEYLGTAQRLSSMTTSSGQRIEYTYQGSSLIRAQAIGVENPAFNFVYRGAGSDAYYETDVLSPSNAKTVFVYDGQRRLSALRNFQTGDVTTYQWSGSRPSRETQPGGVTTQWTYVNDDVATATLPSGDVVTTTYQPNAVNLLDRFATPSATISDSLGLIEDRDYDVSGRLVSRRNGANEATTYTYHPLGHLKKVTSPLGAETQYLDYGKHGHARQMQRDDITVDFVYDTVGNLTDGPGGTGQSAPGLGGVVTRKFDEGRNVVEMTLANLDVSGEVTATKKITIERRADGQVDAIRRPYGGDWEFDHDTLGRATARREKVNGVWRSVTYSYDGYGRQSAIQQANGMRTEWGYDSSDRIVLTRLREDGVTQGTETVTYANGRLVTRSDSGYSAGETFSYDAAGRLARVDFPLGEAKELSYDLRSRTTRERYRDDAEAIITDIVRTYDLADRPRQVFDRGVRVLEHEYTDGVRSLTRYGNGLERSYEYDPVMGMLIGSDTEDELGQSVETSTVDWDQLGYRVDASTQTRGGLNVTKTETYYFGPVLGTATPGVRVWQWSRDGGINKRDFEYDELNNVRSVNDDGSTFHYNAERNRLNSISGGRAHTYTYDESGYATSRDGVEIEWDAGGRISGIGSDAGFVWDVSGRLIARNLAGSLRLYLFGGEMKATFGRDPVSLDLGEVEIRFDDPSRFYRHFDFRGNVKFVSDDDGGVLTHYRYDPYGLEFSAGFTDVEGEFAQGLATAGLVVLGPRAYDPDAARFLAPDPVAQLVNQYVYTMANPVMFWDPTGFESMFLGIAGYAGDMTGAYYGGAYGAGVGAAVGGPPGAVIGGVIGAGLGAFGGRVIFLTVGQFMFQVMNPGQRGIGGPKELIKNAVPFQPIQTEGDRAGMQNGKQAAYDPSASWWQRNACPVGCARPKFTGALGGLTLDFGGGFGGMPGGGGPCGINIELALVVPLLQALHRRKQRRSALRGPLPA